MGTLTVKLKENDEVEVRLLKQKHNIVTKTKVLMYCLHNHSKLENEVAHLQNERFALLTKLDEYKKRSVELLSGISGLQDLAKE